MIDNAEKKRFRKLMILILLVVVILFSISQFVLSADQWDRPIVTVNYTPQFLNLTDQLNNLQNQLYNETAQRISNDTYLQSQINITQMNITQLFQITTIYGINISQLFNITNNLNNDINNIENDIVNIYVDIDALYNLTYELSSNLTNLTDLIVVLNESITILNETLSNLTILFNTTTFNLNSSINDLYNITAAINSSIKQPTGPYLSYNSSNFWINETALNTTINNISKNKQYLYISTINVTSGTGQLTTNYTIEYLLTRITINGLGIFRSQCIEYTNGWIIDQNRIPHNILWDIEKNYAINDRVNCTITNAVTDGIYNITLTYINNGLQ